MRRSRLRIGLGPGLAELASGTGHGTVWAHVLSELRRLDGVKLVSGARADVWLASGHAEPPEGRPLVVQVHEAGWRDPALRALLHPEFAAQIDAATAAALAAAVDVITPSWASRSQVIEAYGIPGEHIHVVHHGVDRRVFKPGRHPRAPVGAPYLLCVAALHPRKNLAAVRRAAIDLAAAGHPHLLVIVGNPAPDRCAEEFERETTAELAGHPGRIVVLRELPSDELAALMGNAQLLCLPSLFEGFGLPVLEAMACGTPVVVSDRGALPEVVGEAGIIVPPDAAAVSEAVRRVVADAGVAARLRVAALARAAGFSWTKTAAGWLDVLRAAA
jgi:glycosyltransferase involved in cell wall biosynthesis